MIHIVDEHEDGQRRQWRGKVLRQSEHGHDSTVKLNTEALPQQSSDADVRATCKDTCFTLYPSGTSLLFDLGTIM